MKQKRLTITDRKKISELYSEKTPPSRIADKTGFSTHTIHRELKRGYNGELNANNHPAYDPHLAQQMIDERKEQGKLKRKKEPKPKPPPKFRHLTEADREKISELHLKLYTTQEIADNIGFNVSTIGAELKRGYTGELDKNNLPAYDPKLAQQRKLATTRKGQKQDT